MVQPYGMGRGRLPVCITPFKVLVTAIPQTDCLSLAGDDRAVTDVFKIVAQPFSCRDARRGPAG